MALLAPTTLPSLDEVLAGLAGGPPTGPGGERLVHLERLAARGARTAELARPLPPAVRECLGVDSFWSHQAEAIDLARSGRSVAVATGTASGKSLCYQAPIAESAARPVRSGTSLLIFPTKALAQDQLRSLTHLEVPGLVAGTYDGDCSPEERTWVRAKANVVLTNPEMLHSGILPHHGKWDTYLLRLDYVVIDELHTLRGIFGTHVAHLLRRLRRLCAHYGSHPTFIFSSATIGEPGRLASQLCGLDVAEVTDDGSPRGERLFALWNPPLEDDVDVDLRPVPAPDAGGGAGTGIGTTLDPDADRDAAARRDPAADPRLDADRSAEAGVRSPGHGTAERRHAATRHAAVDEPDHRDDVAVDERGADELAGATPAGDGPRVSSNRESAAIAAELILHGRRTIAFCRSRKGTEIVAADVRRRLPEALADAVSAYRGGYLTVERRAIEDELFSGRLQGVVATTALELGVDIGGLDACVLNGFPGTIASLWQQAGRAGREAQQSLAVLVAGQDQLDQWLMAHPHEVFTRPPEPAVINPTNPFVLGPHLACAAYELPLSWADEAYWPADVLADGVRSLVVDDRLKIRPRGYGTRAEPRAVWSARGFPSHGIGLRGGSAREVRIALGNGDLVGTVDETRAPRLVHPGATYLHQGRSFQVDALDLDDAVAWVSPSDGTDYTLAKSETEVRILATDQRRALGGAALHLGDIEVRSQVTGYQRRDRFTGEVLAREQLDLPPSFLVTRAFWYTLPYDLLAEADVPVALAPGALHAAEHAAIGMLPLFTICDRWDVGGVSTLLQADTGLPTIVIYDGYAGGAGIAELGYDVADRHLEATLEAIAACACADGCPSCVQSPKCGNFNEPLDKAGAARLLRVLLGGDAGHA